MYANPKGGRSGYIARDGTILSWEPHSAYTIPPDTYAEKILAAYLYRNHPVAFCCAGADLRLLDARPITGPPDIWLRLPERNYHA
ncbi:hypothetical protein AB0F17_12930 [Nonomuraea sp. NPDC026600]|uniref:hypothetical protein n=1 Tax=Nonomuraea sp. NPDC026600 TaxID=3155363 RepID=UPI0033E090F5